MHNGSWVNQLILLSACAVAFDVDVRAAEARSPICTPAGTVLVDVDLTAPPGKALAGVKLNLDYPESAVALPGYGNDPSVKQRVANVPNGFFYEANDLDDALIFAIAGTSALGNGRLLTVELDRCSGTPAPTAKDFICKVEEASTEQGVLVDGSTCTVTAAESPSSNTQKRSQEKVR